ncbi:hypothetical protein B0H19DRAFT_1182082 [Mycena capillaripes]|nr:hypothetical protein B0H19DRAFT_1182082 [Mycena capillaripes]
MRSAFPWAPAFLLFIIVLRGPFPPSACTAVNGAARPGVHSSTARWVPSGDLPGVIRCPRVSHVRCRSFVAADADAGCTARPLMTSSSRLAIIMRARTVRFCAVDCTHPRRRSLRLHSRRPSRSGTWTDGRCMSYGTVTSPRQGMIRLCKRREWTLGKYKLRDRLSIFLRWLINQL